MLMKNFNQNFNPLHPKSDNHLISFDSITSESNIQVTRIKKMITSWRNSRLWNNLTLGNVLRTQYGEYAYWYWGVKGYKDLPIVS